jgi:rubrerythrin
MSDSSSGSTSRRQFLKQAGGAASITALTVSGCDSNNDSEPDPETVSFDFSNDFGVLNYAYALEQLEAAFYAEATANFYGDLSSVEGQYFRDLAAHEGLHRDFLAAAIPALGGELISDLEVDFSNIDFDSRNQVLATSRLLEDTGVSAYNGAGIYLENPDLLAVAGKIVSVEARHAASIRSLINAGSSDFAGDDVVDPDTGFDLATAPPNVLSAVAQTGLVVTPLEVTNLE